MVDVLHADLISSPIRHRLSDRVADDLFRLIVTLQLKPGSILNESALMQYLQCGRTPLREALIALERDHLIKIVPRQATIVTEITVAASAEIYEAMRCLEGPIARLAAERLTAAGLRELEEYCIGLEALDSLNPASPNDVYGLAELDFAFHEAIARAAANSFLLAALLALRGPVMRLMCLSYRQVAALPHLIAEHRAAYQAFAARDPDAAEQAMQDHAEASKHRLFAQAARFTFR